jgi:hypothetical protein
VTAALIDSDALRQAEAEAKERRDQAPGRPQGVKSVSPQVGEQTPGKAAEAVASDFGVGKSLVEQAKR